MLVKSLQKQLERSLPDNVMSGIIYTNTKFSSHFNIKDEIPFQEKHDLIYRSACASESCNED